MGDKRAFSPSTRHGIRSALAPHANQFSTASLEAAATFGEAVGWEAPRDVPRLLQVAETLETFRTRQRTTDPGVSLRSTPAARVERQALLARFGGEVAELRSQVFGGSGPPFLRPADALAWMRGLFERQEAAVDIEELVIGGRRRPAGVDADEWRQESLETDGLPLRWGTIPVTRIWARPGAYPLWPLARLCHRVAGVLVVQPGEVVQWVLTGVPPEFATAVVCGSVVRDRTSDGHEVAVPRVDVTVFTPQLTPADLRELRRAVRAAWPTVDAETDSSLEALERGVRRATVTSTDAELSEIVLELGGEPRHGQRAAFWARVHEAWLGRGNEKVAADSLRRRWRRLQTKRPPEPAPKPRRRGTPGRRTQR